MWAAQSLTPQSTISLHFCWATRQKSTFDNICKDGLCETLRYQWVEQVSSLLHQPRTH